MEVVMAPIVVQQTQPLHQTIWLDVPIMGIVEQPLVHQNISITTNQPIVAITLTCAYYQ
jgi:hypothetical protein